MADHHSHPSVLKDHLLQEALLLDIKIVYHFCGPTMSHLLTIWLCFSLYIPLMSMGIQGMNLDYLGMDERREGRNREEIGLYIHYW